MKKKRNAEPKMEIHSQNYLTSVELIQKVNDADALNRSNERSHSTTKKTISTRTTGHFFFIHIKNMAQLLNKKRQQSIEQDSRKK